MEKCMRKIPSDYCEVDNRIIIVRNGFVNSLKYQTITDWSSAIVAVSFKWFENKEKASSLKQLLTNMQLSNKTKSTNFKTFTEKKSTGMIPICSWT